MFTGFLTKRKRTTAEGPSDQLPAELVTLIETASVVERSEPDPEFGGPQVVVMASRIGNFRWDGRSEAAARIGRAWPGLSEPQTMRAAGLLARVVSSQMEMRGRKRRRHRRRGWLHEYEWPELAEISRNMRGNEYGEF